MRATLSLGRVHGIRVRAHWSVLFIFALILFGLAEGGFPEAGPGRPTWQYWFASAVTSVVFLLSLLAHEISHALVARRNGVRVDDITLWLLGGLARLRSEAAGPGAEFRIAGVGPLVSLALGAAFALTAGLVAELLGAGLVVEALAWLAGINILLALFNTLPAAPLDGGRLLRALVWWKTGSRLRATAVATAAGQCLGWALVGIGLYLVVAGAAFSGIWLVVIGWFVVVMATMEGSQARLREQLGGIAVSEAMTPCPETVPGAATISDFLNDPHHRFRHSAFPVVDDGDTAIGLITLKRADAVPVEERPSTSVARVSMPLEEIPTPHPGDPLARLVPDLQASPAHRALVLEGGRLVGIVTTSDISRVTSRPNASSLWPRRTL
ncbi:site-2 protease family protein [Streptomyces sp. HNM0645]|uniref:site-2 protease family protein n=1 Tax=Streptomyces sp. HNM0645 TaxID=2782343 RepID=UPI0024B77A4E|nr:site-2 protease family protein [Streptomyces sp. HNM0645]MDI9889222.1 site-2 protease family protein [Streptomyces sp. HNM0645]